jgi:hypothetical protein
MTRGRTTTTETLVWQTLDPRLLISIDLVTERQEHERQRTWDVVGKTYEDRRHTTPDLHHLHLPLAEPPHTFCTPAALINA